MHASKPALSRSDKTVLKPIQVRAVQFSSESIMAQNLPFSIDNILRSDFPNPSRISRAPEILYVTPLRESGKLPFVALRCQLDRRMNNSGETGFFTYSAPTLISCPEKDVFQNSSRRREQIGKRSLETPKEGNFYL